MGGRLVLARYRMYTANTTDVALLKRAHQKMVKAVDTVWEGRADGLPYQDKNQLVTMASIIEKRLRLPASVTGGFGVY